MMGGSELQWNVVAPVSINQGEIGAPKGHLPDEFPGSAKSRFPSETPRKVGVQSPDALRSGGIKPKSESLSGDSLSVQEL